MKHTREETKFYTHINYYQMKIFLLLATGLLLNTSGFSQNAGVRPTTAPDKLSVAGTAKTNMRIISTGGNLSDFLIKSNPERQLSFSKEHAGLGVNYIIAMEGAFPSQGPPQAQGTMIGEIKIFTGGYAPYGWAFCQGQLLPVSDYPILFQLIGTTFGGDGRKNFGLPDLRSTVPVGVGSGRYLGERSN